jgi:hypothetical protein
MLSVDAPNLLLAFMNTSNAAIIASANWPLS